MTMTQVWGCLIVLVAAPFLGAFIVLPQQVGDRRLSRADTGLKFALELVLGAGIVLLTRQFFPSTSPWELLGLLALVMGRYWRKQEAAMIAVLGGLLLHDWQITLLVGFIGFVGLTMFRQIRWGVWEILTLITLALVIRYGNQSGYIVAAIALSGTLAWISSKAPDNRDVWRLFKPEAKFSSLDQPLNPRQAGQGAAKLSHLKQQGFPVLSGWLLGAGDDLLALLQFLQPDGDRPFMVRLSSEKPSKRFQIPIEQLADSQALESAILNTFSREDLGQQSILIQAQPQAVWSGITYSRAPLGYQDTQAPLTEVLPDLITPLIVGDRTPQQYFGLEKPKLQGKVLPERIPPIAIIREAAQLSRRLEIEFGTPQSMEWCFDGKKLWILWVRSIDCFGQVWTREYLQTLMPLPLQPLSASLFKQTGEQAIANIMNVFTPQPKPEPTQLSLSASPPEFITHYRGYSYCSHTRSNHFLETIDLSWAALPQITKARFRSILTRPALFFRYLRWDMGWQKELTQDIQRQITPILKTITLTNDIKEQPLTLAELGQNVEQLHRLLGNVLTHYLKGQIILRTRRSLLKVNVATREISQELQALMRIARDIQNLLPTEGIATRAELFATLADQPDGENIFQQIDRWLADYGHQGNYPWELAQKRWWEDPGTIRQWITELLYGKERLSQDTTGAHESGWRQGYLLRTEQRLGTVQDLMWTCLAQLRWSLLAIADHWVQVGKLDCATDIFWLRLAEVEELNIATDPQKLSLLIQHRRAVFNAERQDTAPPPLKIYGQPQIREAIADRCLDTKDPLQGQVASAAAVVAQAKCCRYLQHPPSIGKNDILIVPYLHETLFPFLPQLKGVITTQGGLFSQGARLARELRLPMIINVPNALAVIQTGQWLRLNSRTGQVELLPDDCLFINNG
ncbi:hypothetical protein NIES208_00630 [[Limnothrix rosea] IAM M-220]|nr:hypothetical protein NIES208_00630 [[Limnothrix rosea] IAM M-220]